MDQDTVARRHSLEPIAWLAGIWPLLVVNAAYLMSAQAGLVPWCLPYLEGCTSISRAARQGDAVFMFRATMLPYAALLILYWTAALQWVALIAPQRRRSRRAMFGCGVVGALFLALYVTFLGVEGSTSQWLRRYGINLYFALTVLAQMFLIALARHSTALPARARRGFELMLALLLGLGLASLPLQFFDRGVREAALNALEWQYATLMVLFYPLTAYAWRRSGLAVTFAIRKAGIS